MDMDASHSVREFEKLLMGVHLVNIIILIISIHSASLNDVSFIHLSARSLGANMSENNKIIRESHKRLSLTFIIFAETRTNLNGLHY